MDSFALAWFQLISGQQSDAAGVCIPHSPSAARLARQIVSSSRPAAATAGAGWATQTSGVGLLLFFPGGLGKEKKKR